MKDSAIQNDKSSGFLDRILRPLMKVGLPLMKNVLTSLAKTVLVPLRLTAADAGIHNNTDHIK